MDKPSALRNKKNMKTFYALFISVSICIGNAEARQCYGLFSKEKISDLDRAILAGVDIFNRNKEFVSDGDSEIVYLHGTSVESVQRSLEENYFTGSPVRDLPLLSDVFSHFSHMTVVHAYSNRNSELTSSQLRSLTTYAEWAAKRFYLLRFLNNPKELYNSEFLYELIETLDGALPTRGLIDFYQSEGFFTNKPEVLAKLQSTDLSFLKQKMMRRRGVILILNRSVEKHTILENDVEQHNDALALISKKGIPLSDIKAIVPLSAIERDELLQLLQYTPTN
jgi:hypothetical protein